MVIGASIAGLCAARVLSDFYSTVTVFERDELPEAPANRATVPQDRHLHMLMARGAQEFDSLFPGLLHDMVAAGVPMLENRPDCIYLGAAGHVLGTGHTLRKEFTAYVPSRPHLEWQLRRRVLQLSNVQIVRRLVTEPQFERRQQRVVGVLLDSPGSGQDREREEFIAADLVVDAAGRGTRLPVWLTQWGYRRPAEDTVDIGISYASHQFRIPDGLIAEKVVVAGASHDQSLGLGMLCYEDGTWVLTTFGVADAKPPPTFDEMRTRGQTAAGPLHRRAGASPTDRLSGVSCFPSQQMASLRQAGTFPARNRPVRRCGGQLQSHLRAGHDDDLTASRPPTTGAQSPQLSYERRPGRRTQSGHRQDHLSGVDDERNRRHQFPPRHR